MEVQHKKSPKITLLLLYFPQPKRPFRIPRCLLPLCHPPRYMENLDPGITEVDIYELFDRVGGVAGVRVSLDRLPNSGLSHAHVNFHDRASGILHFRTR